MPARKKVSPKNEKPDSLEAATLFAQQMFEFAQTKEYAILHTRLRNDFLSMLAELVKEDNPTLRGKIQYAQEVIGWFESAPTLIEQIKRYDQEALDDHDY